MDLAIDLGNGGLVAARDAERHPGYLCPHCCVQVHLRRGRAKIAHFAHNPGEGSAQCELYHPGSSVYGIAGDPLADGGMPLYLHLNSDDHGWTMFIECDVLSIAESRNTAYGLLFFDGLVLNRPGEQPRKVRADALAAGSGRNRITITPSRQKLSVRMIGTWPRSIRSNRWQRNLVGLPRGGAVFVKFRGGTYRRYDSMTSVYWGDSVVVVRPDAVIPPTELSPVQLGTVPTAAGTWHAWRVVLPSVARRAVIDWLADFGVVVETRRSRTRIVTPPVEYAGDGKPRFLLGEPVVATVAEAASILIAESDVTISALKLPGRARAASEQGIAVTAIESGPLRLRTNVPRDVINSEIVTETSVDRDSFTPIWFLRHGETMLAPFNASEETDIEAQIEIHSELAGLTFTATVHSMDGRVETRHNDGALQLSKWLRRFRGNTRLIEVDAGNLGFVRLEFDTAPCVVREVPAASLRQSDWLTAYTIASELSGDNSDLRWRNPHQIRPNHSSIVGAWS